MKMDYIDYLNDQRPPPRLTRRLLIGKINPLNDFDDIHLCDRFHMFKDNADEIICLLQPKISCDSYPSFLTSSYHLDVFGTWNLPLWNRRFLWCKLIKCVPPTRYSFINMWTSLEELDALCHIPIKCPSTADAEEFTKRKNWFSIMYKVCALPLCSCNPVKRELPRVYSYSECCRKVKLS